MGLMTLRIALENISGPANRREVDLLVETGAMYSMVPGTILRQMGVQPRERLEFELANGSKMVRDVGEVRFSLNGRSAVSSVIFGELKDAAILGVVTLEEMGLEVDPLGKKLKPTRMILY